MPVMPLGKHKGEDIADVPRDYLNWLTDQDWPSEWLRGIVKAEIDRRSGKAPEPKMKPASPQARQNSVDMDRWMKEQHAFTLELEIVRDNKVMLEDILNRGEADRLANGKGSESVKRLCLAVKRILGIETLDLTV